MIAVLAAAALAGGPGHGAAPQAEGTVTMSARTFAPARTTVLVGETLRWTNQDSVNHTVTALDDAFDSGRIGAGGAYARRFDTPGTVAYRCELHLSMRGTVEVTAVALTQPGGVARAGGPVRLEGRAPAGSGAVRLERADGAVVAEAAPDAEGRFAFTIPADGPAAYRARTGALASALLRLQVAPEVELTARRGSLGVFVRVHASGQAGALVILERHERERFGYVRLRKLRLDADGRARVRLPTGRRLRLRARLSQPVGGFARTVSGVVVVPRDPRVPIGRDHAAAHPNSHAGQ